MNAYRASRIALRVSIICLVLSAAAAAVLSYHPPAGDELVDLRVMETTDLHTYMMNYDYYQDREIDQFGLVRTAGLIQQARAEVKNSLLVDNGDLIQGNPLGDYIAREKGLQPGDVHPVFKAMNLLHYDVGNIGNHEFNYGLEFLDIALSGAAFPYISANVYWHDQDTDPENDKPYFTPYLILNKTVVSRSGKTHRLKVGFIGFVPPQIMVWDKANLDGRVTARDILETAKRYVPQMKAEGADVVIAIPHSGMGAPESQAMNENACYQLARVPGIDAIMFGHSHRLFPGPDYAEGLPGVDVNNGTIHGVAAVMPGMYGSHLGIVDFELEKGTSGWRIVNRKGFTRPIAENQAGRMIPLTETDKHLAEALKEDHEGTVRWLRREIGRTKAPINSYFALVRDDPGVQLVADAQLAYARKQLVGSTYADLPLLSAGAAFKAGYGGPGNYIAIPAGTLYFKNIADLYVYPNTFKVVKLTGTEVKDWLEMSAGLFNQIDPASTEEQPLIRQGFPTFNFDVLDGVTYQIDLSRPAKYDSRGNAGDNDKGRIVNLEYNGKPIDLKAEFLVVTNNYRAYGGGNFPHLGKDKVVLDTATETRSIVVEYVMERGEIDPSADGNWSFLPLNDKVRPVFRTSDDPAAAAYAKQFPRVKPLGRKDSEGYALYYVDLSPKP